MSCSVSFHTEGDIKYCSKECYRKGDPCKDAISGDERQSEDWDFDPDTQCSSPWSGDERVIVVEDSHD